VSLRVAVVHDYLTQRGGAERVALAICRAFPGSRLVTSVYDPARTFPEFRELEIETSYLQRFPLFRRDVRLALPLLPGAFDRLRVDDVDVVVCSSTGWAHGVSTDAPKVVYCHNPARWIYQPEDYGKDQSVAVRTAMRVLRPRLRSWDGQAAATATRYLVNSTTVRDRVCRTYGIDAEVLPPPVGIDVEAAQQQPAGIEPGFFLVVGRARGYKNVEVVCEAFRQLPDQRLVVVGGLPDEGGPWPENVCGLTGIPDAELRWLYANCRAVVAAAHEDFGLTPLEGNAFGRPALVLRAGGFLDTLLEGITGHYIERLDVNSVLETVQMSLESGLDNRAILDHAARYSAEAFEAELQREVQAAVLAHALRKRQHSR
jgi:glycosyltransferase involved in cell wall biosynthesis